MESTWLLLVVYSFEFWTFKLNPQARNYYKVTFDLAALSLRNPGHAGVRPGNL